MAEAVPAMAERPSHRRAMRDGQALYLVFGGRADQIWLRPLKPRFRHCFAAIGDAAGWLVVDPLSGRMVVARLDVTPGFDLPRFYQRAGMAVLGPFEPGPTASQVLPPMAPFSCVAVCRALLGSGAPFALTPWGLYRALARAGATADCFDRKKYLDHAAIED